MSIRIAKAGAGVLVGLAAGLWGYAGCTSDDGGTPPPGTTSPGTKPKTEDPEKRCTPFLHPDGVPEDCGLWVAAGGNDDNDGTQGAPMRSIAKAVERARTKGKRVYVCAEEFEDVVVMNGPDRVYGGLDCANGWRWIGDQKKTRLTAPVGQIPLTITKNGYDSGYVEDFHLVGRSVDPNDPALRGVSSIAMIAQGIGAQVKRSILEAGDAAPGNDGAPWDELVAIAGANGNPGGDACSADKVEPGQPVFNDCGTPDDTKDDSKGGIGGKGLMLGGWNGIYGEPLGTANGGAGESSFDPQCQNALPGDEGVPGDHGAGAKGLGELGIFGWKGVNGYYGKKGKVGQGGGGGGGARGGAAAGECASETSAGGASGGSGASGGCGGKGGRGGQSGGSSIAFLNLSATPIFEDVVLKAGSGGHGGAGGLGQLGGPAGLGGQGGSKATAIFLHNGCDGGNSGNGGDGGRGGGGLGGHSLGIGWRGVRPPSLRGITSIETKTAGTGGAGFSAEQAGEDGIRAELLEIE